MDKGILIGAEHEIAARSSLPFVLFRHTTSVSNFSSLHTPANKQRQSHLFLHHILHAQLQSGDIEQAVSFAKHYDGLVYFPHVLEILLHTVVETEADLEGSSDNSSSGILPRTIEFLDHFDIALDVVVGCARKTEMARWKFLFDIVGNPKTLFQVGFTILRFTEQSG